MWDPSFMLKSCGVVGGGWWVVAWSNLVSAQGPLVLGLGLRVWGQGLTNIILKTRHFTFSRSCQRFESVFFPPAWTEWSVTFWNCREWLLISIWNEKNIWKNVCIFLFSVSQFYNKYLHWMLSWGSRGLSLVSQGQYNWGNQREWEQWRWWNNAFVMAGDLNNNIVKIKNF